MISAKERVRQMLDRLPDDVTLAEIAYHIDVLGQVERGTSDLDEGRWYTQDQVRDAVAEWIKQAEERAFVRQQIKRGMADVEAGRVIDHEEVERMIDHWLRESGQQSSG